MKVNLINLKKTSRGFHMGEFTDLYGSSCSIQKSSLATDDAIWLGVNDANPQILVSDAKKLGLDIPSFIENGWIDYPIPSGVIMTTRMHLNREHVKELLPLLKKFVKTGELK